MADPRRSGKRRSLYVKQNKAYQLLLSLLLIAFILISVLVINATLTSNSDWSNNVFINMIVGRRNR